MNHPLNRRRFLGATTLASAALALGTPPIWTAAADLKPAKLGGTKAHPGGFPDWPVFDKTEEDALLQALKSGRWFRGSGKATADFEKAYGDLNGAKHCLATSSGTTALLTTLGALSIGPGDEVVVPVYTFVATYNSVVLNYALPIFADTDPESFQIDAGKIEQLITPQTALLMPVHIGGSPADLDAIMAVGRKHKIPVVEDACQAHLAEWNGKKVGTLGLAGCFSFQASKNLCSGEGGAVFTQEDAFAENCYNFHNQGRGRQASGYNFTYAGTRGSNYRLSEFQARLLLAQMTRVVAQTERRSENAAYLSKLLGEIAGVQPAKLHAGTTRSAYHLYMFRYDPRSFAGLDKGKFLAALAAEGVPCSGGYGMLNQDSYVTGLAKDRHYLKIYGEKRMQEWLEQTRQCPQNDKVCAQAVWFTQNMLLGSRNDMEQIAEAIRKIQRHAAELKS